APNIQRLSRESFVFEEDHCERVASHDMAFAELLQGREIGDTAAAYPTLVDYIGNGIHVDAIGRIPQLMQQSRPRVVICRDTSHDIAHHDYEHYVNVVNTID